jgi:hypothetical protein
VNSLHRLWSKISSSARHARTVALSVIIFVERFTSPSINIEWKTENPLGCMTF